jgi:hypothetical protein
MEWTSKVVLCGLEIVATAAAAVMAPWVHTFHRVSVWTSTRRPALRQKQPWLARMDHPQKRVVAKHEVLREAARDVKQDQGD